MFKSFPNHLCRLQTKENVKHLVGVPSEQRPGKGDGSSRAPCQSPQCIALGGVALQLVDLVSDRIVEEIRHVSPDEIYGRETADFRSVRFPQRTVQRAA